MNISRKNKNLILAFILMLSFVISSLFVLTSLSQKVFAAPVCDRMGNDQCVDEICDEANRYNPIDKSDCVDAINACENTAMISSMSGFTYTENTQKGTCANALLSCAKTQWNQENNPCLSPGVLAVITGTIFDECEDQNGMVDANGECGVDAAIDKFNQFDGGQDYHTNKGQLEDYKNDFLGICGDENKYDTVPEQTKCKEDVNRIIDECNNELGATRDRDSKTDTQAWKDCIARKAFDEHACEKNGYNWEGGKCVAPPPPPPGRPADDEACKQYDTPETQAQFNACKQCFNDPNSPPPADPSLAAACSTGAAKKEGKAAPPSGSLANVPGRCGQARVNILACGDQGGNVALTNVLRIGVIALTTLVGIAGIGGLAWSAVQYARAGDNQSVTGEAKDRIRNISIGLLLYGFIITIVNWLVPGGIM